MPSLQLSSGFPGGLDGKESACNASLVPSLGQENTLERGMAITSVFLPGDSMDRGARRATVQGVERNVERRQIDGSTNAFTFQPSSLVTRTLFSLSMSLALVFIFYVLNINESIQYLFFLSNLFHWIFML